MWIDLIIVMRLTGLRNPSSTGAGMVWVAVRDGIAVFEVEGLQALGPQEPPGDSPCSYPRRPAGTRARNAITMTRSGSWNAGRLLLIGEPGRSHVTFRTATPSHFQRQEKQHDQMGTTESNRQI